MPPPFVFIIDQLRENIKREIANYQVHKDKIYPITLLSRRIYFTPHHSATEGKSLDSHASFHGADKRKNKAGKYLGRGWPGLAYTFAASAKYGIIQAWYMNTVTYHCGLGNYKSIGAMLEGNFSLRAPTDHELNLMLAMKVEADNLVGRRLIIKYHDEWKTGWECPGKLWPKLKFQKLEEEYYLELNELYEDEPQEQEETQPDHEAKESIKEDPANIPRPDTDRKPKNGWRHFILGLIQSAIALFKMRR